MREVKRLRQIVGSHILCILILGLLWGGASVWAEEAPEPRVISIEQALALANEHSLVLGGARLDLEHAEKQLTKAKADATISPSPVALRQAEIAFETQKLLSLQTQRQVDLEVQNAYFGATSKKQQRDIANTNLQQVMEQFIIIEVKYKEGLATKLDVVNAA